MPNSLGLQQALIEPVLFVLRNGKKSEIAEVLTDAKRAAREVRTELREQGAEVHQPSFDLGAISAFVEILETSVQRSTLNDAVRVVNEVMRGAEILREVGRCEGGEAPVTQGDLAARLSEDPGNFNRKVRRLVDAGLLVDRREGRAVKYSLTALGRDVLDEIWGGWKVDPDQAAAIAIASASETNTFNVRPIPLLCSAPQDESLVFARTSDVVWGHQGLLSSGRIPTVYYRPDALVGMTLVEFNPSRLPERHLDLAAA